MKQRDAFLLAKLIRKLIEATVELEQKDGKVFVDSVQLIHEANDLERRIADLLQKID